MKVHVRYDVVLDVPENLQPRNVAAHALRRAAATIEDGYNSRDLADGRWHYMEIKEDGE